MPKKKKYVPIAKSKSNTSGKPSAAKKEAMDRAKGKKMKPKPPKKQNDYNVKLSSLNPKTPKQLPETYHTLKGMTLRQLLRGTPKLFINNAADVIVTKVAKTKTKSGMPAMSCIAYTSDPYRPHKLRRDHKLHIIGLDKTKTNTPDLITPVNKHKKVLVSCDCIVGETRVLTSDGLKTVFAIVEEPKPYHFPIQYDINGTLHSGTAPYYKGEAKVWKITLSNGLSITATKAHRFLQHVNLGNCKLLEQWTRLKDLNVGDKLLTHENKQSKVTRDTEFWECFFLGVIEGYGTRQRLGTPTLKLYGHKKSILKPLTALGVVSNITDTSCGKGINVFFNHRALEICYKHDFKHHSGIRFGSLKSTIGYLSGLIATDGTTYKEGDFLLRGNKDTLSNLNEALLSFGYTRTTIYMERASGISENKINGIQLTSTKELWAIRFSRQSGLLEQIVLSKYHKDRIDFDKPMQPRKPFVTIVSIQYAGKQKVYDITVPGVERFVANSLIVHNCEAFVFGGAEYANATRGASRIVYGNGNPPVITNPGLHPFACKHLVAFAYKIIKSDM